MKRFVHLEHRQRGPRQRREAGISLLETIIAMSILATGLLMVAAMQLYSLRSGAEGREYQQAAEIARNQMETAMRLPWTSVTPTGGAYAAPAWINETGFAAGEVPVRFTNTSGSGAVQHVFTVNWRVADANAAATLRNVDMRVQWTEESGRARSYVLSSVRSQ